MSESASEEEQGPVVTRGEDAPEQGRLFGPADEVEDNRSTAGKALENQVAPDSAPVRAKSYNPGYGLPDEEREGEADEFAVEGNDTSAYVGVSPEYRGYSNDTEAPHDFDGVEGDSADAIAEASDNSEVVPGPVEVVESS